MCDAGYQCWCSSKHYVALEAAQQGVKQKADISCHPEHFREAAWKSHDLCVQLYVCLQNVLQAAMRKSEAPISRGGGILIYISLGYIVPYQRWNNLCSVWAH